MCPNLIPSSIIIFSYLNLHCFYSSLRHLIHVPVIVLHHCAPCTVFYYRQLCFHNGWGGSELKKELQSYWSTTGTRERSQMFLSIVEGKEKVWQSLSGAGMANTEGFDVETLKDKGLAWGNKYFWWQELLRELPGNSIHFNSFIFPWQKKNVLTILKKISAI